MYFIHIPKTAGTSFRIAAKNYFGDETYFDYGANDKETSRVVVDLEYEKHDRYKVGSYLKKNAKFLGGHVNYQKYHQFFSAQDTISFVRNPAQQVRSHYEHFARHHGFKDSFSSFIKQPGFQNLQSRHLAGIWLDAIGFLGVTEQYAVSLQLINDIYGIGLEYLDINKNSQRHVDCYQLSNEEIELITELNDDDFSLYSYAKNRLERHSNAVRKKLPFTRSSKMEVTKEKIGKAINGWVCCYENDEARTVQVYNNDELLDEILASEYRPQTQVKKMPREGFIGFSYNYPSHLKSGTMLYFRDKETYQMLFNDQVR